jgi:hypothetical protein
MIFAPLERWMIERDMIGSMVASNSSPTLSSNTGSPALTAVNNVCNQRF